MDTSILDAVHDGRVALPVDVAHRFLRVLRLEPGTVVEVFDGGGRVARGTLEAPGALVNVEITTAADPLPPFVVAQAITKTDKLELVLQKGTELGASTFLLVDTMRGQVHLEGDRAEKRRDRLARGVLGHARQCGRVTAPVVEGPVDVKGLSARIQAFPGVSAVGHVTAQAPLSEVLAANPDKLARGFLVVVGPEGGLDDREARMLVDAGAVPVQLGVHVLRTETAALVALAAAQAALGHL